MKKMAPNINPATLYSGRSRHAIDSSNRIMLNGEWRGEGAPSRFFVIVPPSADHLVICPPAVFESFLQELREATADKTQIPEIERELNERVRQVGLDGVGRLPLPREFTEQAGIEKQGELVGRFSKFEIWACDKYPQPRAAKDAAAATVSERLGGL